MTSCSILRGFTSRQILLIELNLESKSHNGRRLATPFSAMGGERKTALNSESSRTYGVLIGARMDIFA